MLFRSTQGTVLIVAALAAVVAVASSLTLAGAHGGDTSKVHSCVNKYTGGLRIIAANSICTLFENPLDWSQSGAAGPSGPVGPTGATGPAGAGGQLNGVREYTSSGTFTVPAGSRGSSLMGALITAAGGRGGTVGLNPGGAGGGGTLPASPSGQGIVRAGTDGVGEPTNAGGIATRGSIDVVAGDGGRSGQGSLVNGHPGLSGWMLIQW